MNRNARIAIAAVIALLLAAGLIFYFHQPSQPAPTEYFGVGLALRMDPQSRAVVIDAVVPDSPAAAAGITNGLVIGQVDGVPLEGKTLVECVNLIRGPAGTKVQLELVTPGGNQTNVVELTRRKLNLSPLKNSPGP